LSDTLVAVISGKEFMSILLRHGPAAVNVLRGLAQIIRDGDDWIMDLSTLSAFQRVFGENLRRAKPDKAVPGQWIIWPFPPERDIASCAGTTRETVARAVSELRKAGLAQRKNLNFYIQDRDKIVALVDRYRTISKA
jgi:CRP-like cAMP-binding protein